MSVSKDVTKQPLNIKIFIESEISKVKVIE